MEYPISGWRISSEYFPGISHPIGYSVVFWWISGRYATDIRYPDIGFLPHGVTQMPRPIHIYFPAVFTIPHSQWYQQVKCKEACERKYLSLSGYIQHKRLTSAPIGAWKCDFPSFLEITDKNGQRTEVTLLPIRYGIWFWRLVERGIMWTSRIET